MAGAAGLDEVGQAVLVAGALAATGARRRQRPHPLWLGEVEGLRQTLTALRDKKQHVERLIADGVIDTPQAMG